MSPYRLMLARPGEPARKRGLRTAGRIVGEFAGRELRSITTAQVERFLARLDTEPVSKRTINKHRQVVCSILEHAARRPERFGITKNVARATAKRREPDAGVLDFYEPKEVAALARAAREGRHRDPRRPAVSEAEARERSLADEQDAAEALVRRSGSRAADGRERVRRTCLRERGLRARLAGLATCLRRGAQTGSIAGLTARVRILRETSFGEAVPSGLFRKGGEGARAGGERDFPYRLSL